MKVTVKLFATFREGREKIQLLELREESTAEEVISLLRIKREEVAILLINGRDGAFDKALSQGDIISIFPPVGGG
jgi:sulfur carrier protein